MNSNDGLPVEYVKKRAKRILKAVRHGDENIRIAFFGGKDIVITLMKVQHKLARLYGYKDWKDLLDKHKSWGSLSENN